MMGNLPSSSRFATTLRRKWINASAIEDTFQQKSFYLGFKLGNPMPGLLVSCINSTADTKLSFPYTDTRKFLKAPQEIS